jgi:hypothetical protein
MGVLGLDLGKAGRTMLMNHIGAALNIPPGGWAHGLSRLFVAGEPRIVGLLGVLAREKQAARVAENLRRAGRFSGGTLMLAVVTTAREHVSALTAHGSGTINSFSEGGLDFLADQMNQLGLPHALTMRWHPLRRRINPETGNEVHPARIPAVDQLIVYAAQLNASFEGAFKRYLRAEAGADADRALRKATRMSTLVWRAYSFLAPGGRPFDPELSVAAQSGQPFGIRTALAYVHRESEGIDLDRLTTDPQLNMSNGFGSRRFVLPRPSSSSVCSPWGGNCSPSRNGGRRVMYRIIAAVVLVIVSVAPAATRARDGKGRVATSSAWEKIFAVDARESWVSAVWAVSDEEWFVGGKGFGAHSSRGTVTKERLQGDVILGFGTDGKSLFALGADQLILRVDGRGWRREHEARSPAKARRADPFVDVLDSAQRLEEAPTSPLLAFGPSALLARRGDGTWVVPSPVERVRLLRLASLGRLDRVPRGCDSTEWSWLGEGRAWFLCADRRAFLVGAGPPTSVGIAPRGCYSRVSATALDGGDLLVGCESRGLWREHLGIWTQVPAPSGIRSVSVGGQCAFVATKQEVWRRCEAP